MNFVSVLGFILVAVTVYCNALDPLTSAPSHQKNGDRKWKNEAVHLLWKERTEMGRTPLVSFAIEGMPHLDFRFKNESASKTGNLKHRFSWALYMWALTEGFIDKNTTVYEASSGNTATCEAYMAKVIGVPFVAVVPDTTEQAKIDNIEKWGGKVQKADISKTFEEAEKLAKETNGFYMNQFGNAFLAEEFHESGASDYESMNVMHEIMVQLKQDSSSPPPHFFVHTAGTGGTISSVGRYIQKYGINTEVILADTQYSMYYDYVINGRFSTENDSAATLWVKPGMAGTGYGYAGPGIRGKTTSLLPAAIDIAYKIPDLASTAAMHVLKENGIEGGTSTGLNFITSLSVGATEKEKAGNDKLRIITLLCDSSSLYESSYYNVTWIKEKFEPHGGIPTFECWKDVIKRAMKEGFDPIGTGNKECKTSEHAIPSPAAPSSNPENPLPPSPDTPVMSTPSHKSGGSFSAAPEGPSTSPASQSKSPSEISPSSGTPLRPRISRQPNPENPSPSSESVLPSNSAPSVETSLQPKSGSSASPVDTSSASESPQKSSKAPSDTSSSPEKSQTSPPPRPLNFKQHSTSESGEPTVSTNTAKLRSHRYA